MKTEQLSIFVENKPGRLADVAATLAAHNIDLRALSLADTADFGIIRLIVNKPEEARKILKQEGFRAEITAVLAVEVPDQPGSLSKVLGAFAAANLNVEYMYAFVSKGGDGARMIFRLDDIDRAIAAFPADAGRIIPAETVYNM